MKAPVFDTKGNESDVYSSEIPAEFQKLERFAARKAVVAAVDALGLLEEIKPHDLTVPYGDRGGVVIEPMLTDQWYVRADVLAKPAVEAVENGDIQFVPKQYENMYFSRCAIFRTGVSHVSCGGVTVSRHGTTKQVTFMLAATKTKCVKKITSVPTLPCVRTKTFSTLVLLRAVDLLHARLAGKHRRPASVPPNQRDGIWFRHHLLLDCPHDHDDHALHQR